MYGRDNAIQNFVALFSDISAQKQPESELEHIAYFDPLTGLPNRVLLYDRVQRALVHAQRHQLTVSVLYLDPNGFKNINDRFGHDFGDKVLAEVGTRLRGMLREQHTVARIGGDQFVAMLVELPDTLSCVDLLPRLLARIGEPMQSAGHQLEATASLGSPSTRSRRRSMSSSCCARPTRPCTRPKWPARTGITCTTEASSVASNAAVSGARSAKVADRSGGLLFQVDQQ